ncbi:hypothetical protein FQZ97_475050 [compost metagenome]
MLFAPWMVGVPATFTAPSLSPRRGAFSAGVPRNAPSLPCAALTAVPARRSMAAPPPTVSVPCVLVRSTMARFGLSMILP